MLAPSSRQASSLYAVPAVTATRAPTARASWIAIVPIPLDPPWIRIVCPGCRLAVMNTLDHTVHATSGSAAASTSAMPFGTGSSWAAGTATCSAYPPPESSAHTLSPTAQPVTLVPRALIVPLTSRPGYFDEPGGGG